MNCVFTQSKYYILKEGGLSCVKRLTALKNRYIIPANGGFSPEVSRLQSRRRLDKALSCLYRGGAAAGRKKSAGGESGVSVVRTACKINGKSHSSPIFKSSRENILQSLFFLCCDFRFACSTHPSGADNHRHGPVIYDIHLHVRTETAGFNLNAIFGNFL